MFPHAWIITALDIIPAAFTIIGNSIFFITLWKTTSLHTPSNTLLGFLSAIDLVVGLVCHPLFLITIFHTDRPCCTQEMLVYNFTFFLTSWNSYLCVAMITADRGLAVLHPFRYREIASCKRFSIIAAFIFLVSSIYVIIDQLFYDKSRMGFLLFNVICQLFILSLISIIYILIYRAMHRQNKRIVTITDSTSRKLRRKSRTEQVKTKKVALIIFTFVFCTLPYTIYKSNMYLFYIGRSRFITGFGFWANFFFLLNSAINPLIYFISRSDFRFAAKRIFSRLVTNGRNIPGKETKERNSTMSASKHKITFTALHDGIAVIENLPKDPNTNGLAMSM